MRGSYRPYTGDDYRRLAETVDGDANPGALPSAELMALIGKYKSGDISPSELLMSAHADGVSVGTVDRALGSAGVSGSLRDMDDEGTSFVQPEAGSSSVGEPVAAPASSAGQAAEGKIGALENARESTADLAAGKAEAAAEKADLAADTGDQEAAENAEKAARSALKKGKEAIASKAKAAGKIVIGQALTGLEQSTGGKAGYDTSAFGPQGSASPPPAKTADGQSGKTQAAAETFDESLKRQKQSQERPTTNLGRWGDK